MRAQQSLEVCAYEPRDGVLSKWRLATWEPPFLKSHELIEEAIGLVEWQ
jgi:hypothetical protein